MTDFRRDERDEERRERRRRREHSSRKERDHDSHDRDIVQGPEIEELRRVRTDFYATNGTSSRRIGAKVTKMPSAASASRTSLSSTKSASRHRHKSRRKHGSASDTSHGRRKSKSKDTREKLSTEEFVYKVGGERVTETRTTYLERPGQDVSPEQEQTMSDIEEEPEDNKKVKVVYVKKEKPRSSRHSPIRHSERERPRSEHRVTSSRKIIAESELPVDIKRWVLSLFLQSNQKY